MLDIMLQVGKGAQRDFIDGEFAGINSAHRDEIDQIGDRLVLTLNCYVEKPCQCDPHRSL
jgi:hypothetical protein